MIDYESEARRFWVFSVEENFVCLVGGGRLSNMEVRRDT